MCFRARGKLPRGQFRMEGELAEAFVLQVSTDLFATAETTTVNRHNHSLNELKPNRTARRRFHGQLMAPVLLEIGLE